MENEMFADARRFCITISTWGHHPNTVYPYTDTSVTPQEPIWDAVARFKKP